MSSFRFYSCTLIAILAGALAACSTPSERISKLAKHYGLSGSMIEGSKFKHQIYRNNSSIHPPQSILHIYLGGDGSPWIKPGLIAKDPTSRSPLTLKLMSMDSTPSLYLGRPCYHGHFNNPPCNPQLWTSARYSEIIVASMTEILRKIMLSEKVGALVFFGYSGGGTLAVLLAERFTETLAVVTIAGNLDIDAWTKLHNYTKLKHSLNPSKRVVLDSKIHQLHIVGGHDLNVKQQFVATFESKQSNSELVAIDAFDHGCCWATLWNDVLTWSAVIESSQGKSKESFNY